MPWEGRGNLNPQLLKLHTGGRNFIRQIIAVASMRKVIPLQKCEEEHHCEESSWDTSILQVYTSSNFLRVSSQRRSTAVAVWKAAATASAGPVGDDGRNDWAGSGATIICTTARPVRKNEWANSNATTAYAIARPVGR